jgi:hypothetical protein
MTYERRTKRATASGANSPNLQRLDEPSRATPPSAESEGGCNHESGSAGKRDERCGSVRPAIRKSSRQAAPASRIIAYQKRGDEADADWRPIYDTNNQTDQQTNG